MRYAERAAYCISAATASARLAGMPASSWAILGDVSTRNVELTNEAFDAMNHRDLDWLIAHCDPGVEMHMRGVAGEPVRYVGPAGVREYFRDIAEIWESVEFVPEEIRDLGDNVFVILRQRFRGRGSGVDVEGRLACTHRLRDGALIELRSYCDVAEGLAAAGLDQ
jgi:ketosteroid isomerase-like protein